MMVNMRRTKTRGGRGVNDGGVAWGEQRDGGVPSPAEEEGRRENDYENGPFFWADYFLPVMASMRSGVGGWVLR
jgi:hypothetical protein